MENFELSIIWWNTSLSPPVSSKRDKSSDEKRASIASVIQKFMENDYEFICLGEVGPEDIIFFEENIFPQKLGYFCAKGIDGVGRTFFDTCIYYKKDHDLIRNGNSDVQNFTMASATRTFKYGQKYRFSLCNNDKITVYLSHWPSRLNDVSLQTISIAERLRVNIEDELQETRNIILVGDYNVEPYDNAVVHQLQCSREKSLVLKKPNVFYNPCWKFLAPSFHAKPLNTLGTYYYANGQFHNWHIIDQIMFSSNFLSDEWDFKDKYINILKLNHLDDTQKFLQSDHYPLSAVILRK
ncbi:endonuclease/exonuclease/phosphatase family protein [Acinetobacter baumannii]|nr:endonuclease/exonuclease/phosphatase family protein [Acinetobacter baumannii]ELA9137771.1 endonuclease/exonuclease/phosphatase family protein [Acinetobacter baumannii]ELW9271201.1 endonuclease/exonuclease/phosphatase family protein [Acinetobacter baumannii]HCA5338645.1 endonuclease/exonuclease/phosphatase family protein [Acinetobacter baumannii]